MPDLPPHIPTQEEIARCAFLIWEREGRPEGREEAHWHEAESQILAMIAHQQAHPDEGASPREGS